MSAAAEDSLRQATNAVVDYCPTINLPTCLSGVNNVESPFILLQGICSRQKDLMEAPTKSLREAVLYATRDIVDAVVSQLWTRSRSQINSSNPDGDTATKLVELRAVIPVKIQSTLHCLLWIRTQVSDDSQQPDNENENGAINARYSVLEKLLKGLELLRQLFDDLTELYSNSNQQSFDRVNHLSNGIASANMAPVQTAALQQAQAQMNVPGGSGNTDNTKYSLFDNIPSFTSFEGQYGMGRDPKTHYSLFADPTVAKNSWRFPAEIRNVFSFQQQQYPEQISDKFYQRSSAMSIPVDNRNYHAAHGERLAQVDSESPRDGKLKPDPSSPQHFYSASLPNSNSTAPSRARLQETEVLSSTYDHSDEAFNFDSMAESLLTDAPYEEEHKTMLARPQQQREQADAYYGSSAGSGTLSYGAGAGAGESVGNMHTGQGESFASAVRRRPSNELSTSISSVSSNMMPQGPDDLDDVDDMTGWVEPPVRYKTAMCKRIIDSSKCRYSKACGFAHSEGEKDNFSRLHLATVKCQFGRKCRNPTCGRAHTPQAQQDAMALYAEAVGSCRLIVGAKT
eukprot:CFRG1083T1